MQQLRSEYLLSEVTSPIYDVYFDNYKYISENPMNIVISTKRELELLILCLRDNIKVVMNQYEEIYNKDSIYLLLEQNIDKIKWTYKEYEEVKELITKIPMPTNIKQQLNIKERIDKRYVHKTCAENVMISDAVSIGNMYYFKGNSNTEEIELDHKSNHMAGIMIFEAVRQAGIASIHLLDIPLDGVIIITKSLIEYNNFIDEKRPYYIQTIPTVRPRGGIGYCVFNVIQDGKSCVKGYFCGFLYKTKNDYEKFMKRISTWKK